VTRPGTAPAKLHDANWAATTFRHQVPELVPDPGLLGAGRCSWAETRELPWEAECLGSIKVWCGDCVAVVTT